MSNTDSIKVSVVMPVYNSYDYLRCAIDGVLGQTLEDIELILVDDGSTDRSLDIIKEYKEKDSRVRVITESNAGPSWARNRGLARIRGRYVIFLDSDDIYEPELIERLYLAAERDGLDIAIAEYDIYNQRTGAFEHKIPADRADIFEGGRIVSKQDNPSVIFQCAESYVWNKLFSASFLQSRELSFDQDLRVFEDVYMVMTSLALADRVGKINDVLIHHRIYPNQSRTKFFNKYYMQVPDIYLRIKDFLMSHGSYLPLLESFENLSASRCFKVYNVLWWEAKHAFWAKLHEGGVAEALGWDRAIAEGLIWDDEVREFASSALVNTHKAEIKRFRRGLSLKTETVRGKLRRLRLRKRLAAILAWMFGKSKYHV
ncbi:MAG: glycosyltransferase family 2 protein [Clostridia bacterium]|nr:glycosyltransferase family 2 protein [Clostridia bacterium]